MAPEFTTALLAFVIAVFLVAGFVKGVLGLGLPTIAVGLLATRMPPANAIAIVIAPSIITNLWQTFAGPYLKTILKRQWPLLAFSCIGVWSGRDLLTGHYAPYGTVVLGLLLIVYAVLSLTRVRFYVPPRNEKWVGGICGYLSGLIASMTGAQVFPSMPYLQAVGMERDEMIQALGIFFTVGTVAMIFNLTSAGLLNVAVALPGLIALTAAFLGMFIGQFLRERMAPETFRRWFLIAMALLGGYLAIDKLVELHFI